MASSQVLNKRRYEEDLIAQRSRRSGYVVQALVSLTKVKVQALSECFFCRCVSLLPQGLSSCHVGAVSVPFSCNMKYLL